MNEKDLFDFDYSLYLEHLAICQNNTVRCVAEAVCISENQIDQLMVVNEAFIDTVKNIINRIIALVKKQFAKFTQSMANLFTPDSKWLRDPKIKAIILNNNWKDREPFDMTKYNEELLTGNKLIVKPFDFEHFKKVTTSDNPETTFTSTYFDPNIIKGGTDVKDLVKSAIAGDSEEVRITSLPKEKMYNFCLNWEKTLKSLNEDVNKIDSGRDTLARELGIYTRELKDALDKEAATAKNESMWYSILYYTYMNEDGPATGGATPGQVKPPEATKDTDKTDLGKVGTGTVQTGVDKLNVDSDQTKEGIKNMKGEMGENSEKYKLVKKMEENTSNYFTYLSNIVMGKITAAQAMYKDYMKLLKMHVKDYAGEKAASSGSSTMVGTDPGLRKTGSIGDTKVAVDYVECTERINNGDSVVAKDGAVYSIDVEVGDSVETLLNKYEQATKIDKTKAFYISVSKINSNDDTDIGVDKVIFNNGKWYHAKVTKQANNKK